MILVTGGTGLLGAHLLYKLTKDGKRVRAIYRTERKLNHVKQVFSTYNETSIEQFNAIEWVQADLLNIPALTDAFNAIKIVYHCAAFVSFEPDKYHQLRRTNIEGTANIVNISLSNNIDKLCYVSSIATLGTSINGEAITEQTFWNPEQENNVYSITKYGAEMEVWRGTQEGLNAVIVNPGVILGAGIWHYGTGSFFKRAYKGITYYTKGTVALIDVEDVVNIMITLTNSPIKNERFILVAENWFYKKFLQALAKSVNKKTPKKLASTTLLNVVWRIDWIVSKLTGRRRQITKQLAKSLQSKTNYSNEKVKAELNYSFKPIGKTIINLGKWYLKQAE